MALLNLGPAAAGGCLCGKKAADSSGRLPADTRASFAEHSAGNWDISVDYPRFRSPGPVANRANVETAAAARAEFEAFLAQAKDEVPRLHAKGSTASYELLVSPAARLDTPELCSAAVQRYEFTGGANGFSSYSTYNFGLLKGELRPLSLSDLFRPGHDARAEASAALDAVLHKLDPLPSDLRGGVPFALNAEQAERFSIDADGLNFYFNKYELGVGAEGDFVVPIPFSALPGLDPQGCLKPLLGAAD